jgi:hypothetical protein
MLLAYGRSTFSPCKDCHHCTILAVDHGSYTLRNLTVSIHPRQGVNSTPPFGTLKSESGDPHVCNHKNSQVL